MDTMPGEKLNYEEEASEKKQHYEGGAISAPAEDELIDDDDEYDELYGDLTLGEGFLQLPPSEAPAPNDALNVGFQTPETDVPESTPVNLVPKELNVPGGLTDDKYTNHGVPLPDAADQIADEVASKTSQKARAPDVSHASQVLKLGFQGSTVPVAQNGARKLLVGALHWWTTDAEIESVLSKYGRVKEFKFFDEKRSGISKGYCLVEFYDSAAAAACRQGMNGYKFNGRACTVAFASPHTARQMVDSHRNTSHARLPPSPSQPQGRRPLNDNAVIITCPTNYPTGDLGRGYGRGTTGWARGQGGGNWRHGPTASIGASMGPNMPYARGFGSAGANSGVFMHPHPMMGAGFDPMSHMGRGLPRPVFPGMIPPFRNVNALGISGAFPPVNPGFFGRGMAAYGMGMMRLGNVRMEGPGSGMWNHANMGGGRPQQLSETTSDSSSDSEANTGGERPEQGSQMTRELSLGSEANTGGGRVPEQRGQRTRESSLGSEANAGGGRLGRQRSQRTRESSFGSEDRGPNYGYSSDYNGPITNTRYHGKEQASKRNWSVDSDKRRDPDREHRYRDSQYMREHQYRQDRYRDRQYMEHRYREHRYREEKDDYDNHQRKDRYWAYKDDWDRGQTSARWKSRSRAMEEDHRSRSRDDYYGKRRRLA